MLLLVKYLLVFCSSVFSFVICGKVRSSDSKQYSYDNSKKSTLDTHEITKYIDNHTEIYNYHLIPGVIDSMPRQSCGMLYKVNETVGTQIKEVKYDAHFGALLRPIHTQKNPFWEWYDAYELDYWTVIMIDIDAPDPKNPIHKSWLHYLAVNSKGFKNVPNAQVIAEYVGPWPLNGTGQHRYVGMAYKQPSELDFSAEKYIPFYDFISRRNFDHRAFARKYNLAQPPECVNFFTAEWEEFVDKEYRRFYFYEGQ